MTLHNRVLNIERRAGAIDKPPAAMSLQELYEAGLRALHDCPQDDVLRREIDALGAYLRGLGI